MCDYNLLPILNSCKFNLIDINQLEVELKSEELIFIECNTRTSWGCIGKLIM
jgi:hypothetical protein